MTPNFATKGRKEKKEKDHQGSILPQVRNLREDQTTVSIESNIVFIRRGAPRRMDNPAVDQALDNK